MPIVVPQKRQKEGTLDKIAKGLNIAEGLLGIGLAIPKYIQDRNTTKKQLELSTAGREMDILSGTEPDDTGFVFTGQERLGGRKVVPKDTSMTGVTPFKTGLSRALEAANEGKFFGYKKFDKGGNIINDFTETPQDKSWFEKNSDYQMVDPKDFGVVWEKSTRLASEQANRMQQQKQFQQNVTQYWNTNSDQFRKEIGDELKDQSALVRNLKSINNVGELRGNQVALNIVRNNIARSIGSEKGVMTDRDFVRVAPGSLKETVSKAWNWVTSDVGDVVSEPERKALGQLMETATFNTAISRSIRAGDLIQTRESQLGQSMPKPQTEAYKKQFGDWEKASELDQLNTKLRELSKITDPKQITATQNEFNNLLIE
jgi:hypothetical protein